MNSKGKLCGNQYLKIFHSVCRHIKIKSRKPIDPEAADKLPVYEYVGEQHQLGNRVYTWGVAAHGALGRASFIRPRKHRKSYALSYMQRPHRLSFGEYNNVTDVACGYGFTLLSVKNKNGPTCFGTGNNTDSQIGQHEPRRGFPLSVLIEPAPLEPPLHSDAKIIKAAGGRAHSLLLTDCDGVWSLGNNSYGQCGRPVIPNEDYQRKATYHKIQEFSNKEIAYIECGQDTSFFINNEGEVFSCGWGSDGQTGRGHYNNEPHVGHLEGDIKGEKIIKVSCRADCALALSEKGEVFGWGNSEYRQLASVTDEMQINVPLHLKLKGIKKVKDIASAGTACFVISDEDVVYTWGFGLLGLGPKKQMESTPFAIPNTLFGCNELTPNAKPISISCGINMTAVINNYGNLFTWGQNHGGMLGIGHIKQQYFPFRVSIAASVKKISCGADHVAVLAKDLI